MYVTYLDASKAYDSLNYTKFFSKVLKLGVPKYLIKVICQWYRNQIMYVKWGSVFSNFFAVNNGVRYGGMLSTI